MERTLADLHEGANRGECRTASADTKGASCVLIKEGILYQVFFLGQLMCRGFLGSHTY